MTSIVIASAARTAVGSFNGAFANVPAHELGAAVIRAALERAGVEPGEVSETILGQVLTAAQDQPDHAHSPPPALSGSITSTPDFPLPLWSRAGTSGSRPWGRSTVPRQSETGPSPSVATTARSACPGWIATSPLNRRPST